MSRGPRKHNVSLDFHGPVIILTRIAMTIAYLVPVIWIVLTSLKTTPDAVNPHKLLIFTPTLETYAKAIHSDLLNSMLQSLIIATGTTVVVLAVALPAAYGLARVPGSIAIIGLACLVVLQMLPQTATVIPLFQVLGRVRLIDSTIGVILSDAAMLTPWATLLLRPFFRSIPVAIEESAAIDGASPLRTFFSIMLPMARNGAFTTGTLVFILSWGEFLYAITFLLSPPKYPLSARLAVMIGLYSSNWSGLMTIAVLTALPILILFVFTYRLLREGLTLGAVK